MRPLALLLHGAGPSLDVGFEKLDEGVDSLCCPRRLLRDFPVAPAPNQQRKSNGRHGERKRDKQGPTTRQDTFHPAGRGEDGLRVSGGINNEDLAGENRRAPPTGQETRPC